MRLGGGHPDDRGIPEPTSGPTGACTTCNGRIWSVRHGRWITSRETVGMVCQTCGTDYALVTVDEPRPAGERELTLSSHGRWLGWHWELDGPPTEGTWIRGSYTGYAFTRWGARRAATAILRRERRRRTERTAL